MGHVRTLSAVSFGSASLLLSACATAASAGDNVIRKASFGRVQATPLSDTLATKDCREALTSTYGFPRESRGMKNGVFVVQTFDCKANKIVARVSLNNYTKQAMSCFAETESGRQDMTLAAGAAGSFEYSYADQVYLDCEQAG